MNLTMQLIWSMMAYSDFVPLLTYKLMTPKQFMLLAFNYPKDYTFCSYKVIENEAHFGECHLYKSLPYLEM